jgi:hypothetical protein
VGVTYTLVACAEALGVERSAPAAHIRKAIKTMEDGPIPRVFFIKNLCNFIGMLPTEFKVLFVKVLSLVTRLR